MSRHVVQCKQSVLVSARVMVGVVTAGPAGAATNRRQCAALARYAQAQDESGGDNGFVRGRSAVAHTLSAMYSYSTVYGNPVTYFSSIAVARLAFTRICVAQQMTGGERR